MGTIAADISNDQELLRQDVRLFMEWCHNQLNRFFAKRKAVGDLVPSTNPDTLADFCFSVMQGGMLVTKINRSPHAFENAAGQALVYIKSLRR